MEKLTQYLVSVALLWNQIPEKSLEPCKTSMVVFFLCENSWLVKVVNNFCMKVVNNFRMKVVSVCQGSK